MENKRPKPPAGNAWAKQFEERKGMRTTQVVMSYSEAESEEDAEVVAQLLAEDRADKTRWELFSDDQEIVLTHGRKKTERALRRFVEAIPQQDFDRLPLLTLYVPSVDTLGQVPSLDLANERVLVYFAPRLEREQQGHIDFVVAHEIAHAMLGHRVESDSIDTIDRDGLLHEVEATALAEKWGFKCPKGMRPHEQARKRRR